MVFRLQITILVAETGLPWENSPSLLGETARIPWQSLVCCRWFTAHFIKYSHPEESPLLEGATLCVSLPTLHTTHKHTHVKRRMGGEDRPCPTALLPYPTHFAHMVSTHLELQKLETSLLMYREPGGNGGS